MSQLLAAPAHPLDLVEHPADVTGVVSQAPILITEREVVFSTAAAVPLPHTQPLRTVIATLPAIFLSSSVDARPAPRHYPSRRDSFLEQAAMVREMRRL